jgi:hypothetical protein
MADLSSYAEKILTPADKTLFDEAVRAAGADAVRAAYILIWITAAESLKRKFNEAAQRDENAAKVIQKIENLEAQHSSVDIKLLKEAKDYGFIDDSAHQKLKYIYDMRSIYAHPYESAPSEEELLSAVDVVVQTVLSKPTTFKKTFVDTVLQQLQTNANYIENSKEQLAEFADEISTKMDPTIYGYLMNSYFYFLEKNIDNPSLGIFSQRGVWFLSEFLKKVGTNFYSHEKWHDFVSKYPKASQRIFLNDKSLLNKIGARAKNTIISYTINSADKRPYSLKKLEEYFVAGELTAIQRKNFLAIDIDNLKAAGISVSTAYQPIIDTLKIHTWPTQKIAIEMIEASSYEDLSSLSSEQQEQLGRNVLQVAEGNSWSALSFIGNKITQSHAKYPRAFINGLIFECFLDDQGKFRIKVNGLERICKILVSYPEITTSLTARISKAESKGWINPTDYRKMIEIVSEHASLASLAQALKQNESRLITLLE